MGSIAVVNLIFGVIASGIMIALCIPQLISIFKTKKVGNVSYATFLIYFFGGFLFSLIMIIKAGVGTYAFNIEKTPDTDPIINILGNVIFTILMALTITTFFVFDKKQKNAFKIGLGVMLWSLTLVVTIWAIMAYASPKFRLNLSPASIAMTVLTILATCCTALPFSIQIAKTIKLKSSEGLSVVMLYMGLLLNACLFIYLCTLLPVKSAMFWIVVVFQTIAIIIYSIQITLYYVYKKHCKTA
ncbi:PQ-loop repeat-containing protein [Mycoplasmopsis felifaucium]|uniref:PQ-loop repeat-containing protein n=1 Tax=Mycoplasmopsis felifaucium TaxID=35768 RepID=A0ABZ2RT73_9BACT|nr:PQ-loop repeat-containing protein [Mycoplasmopsis felifaucium]